MSGPPRGDLRKLHIEPGAAGEPVRYALAIGDGRLALNARIGTRLRIVHSGRIHCVACARRTARSYGQGHCFACLRRLARCDTCIVRPELCHYHLGTCREPQWGEANCLRPHVVYLANASGPKVGITRQTQLPTRWLDQGAVQALPVLQVSSRRMAGLAEVALKAHVSDRTDWRAMLRADPPPQDLAAHARTLLARAGEAIEADAAAHGETVKQLGLEGATRVFDYPVARRPAKMKSFALERDPCVEDMLVGLKGQYLLFEQGVLNVRRHAGYEVTFEDV